MLSRAHFLLKRLIALAIDSFSPTRMIDIETQPSFVWEVNVYYYIRFPKKVKHFSDDSEKFSSASPYAGVQPIFCPDNI